MKLLEMSVIIPTRNRLDSLIETIEHMYNCEYVPNQIIIVDQSNIEISKEVQNKIKEYKNIDMIYEYQELASLTKARNNGIRLAKNEIIIFSDDDIYVENNTMYNIFNSFKENESISLIAAVDTFNSKTHNSRVSSFMGYIFLRKSYNKKEGYIKKSIFGRYPSNLDSIIKTQWAMGYFFALRKSMVENGKIYFDENLKSYAYPEDLDFTYRFNKYSNELGMDMIIDPNIRVEHRVSQEWRLTTSNHTLMYIIHREYLSYKLFPNSLLSRIMTRWSNLGEFIKRVIERDNPTDIIKAQYICDKYRKDIKSGNIPSCIFD